MAEIEEASLRSEQEVQSNQEQLQDDEILITREIPMHEGASSVFTEFLDPSPEEVARQDVNEVTEKVLTALKEGKPYQEYALSLSYDQYRDVVKNIEKIVEKDAQSEDGITPEKLKRADFILHHSLEFLETQDEALSRYIADADARLGLQRLDSGESLNQRIGRADAGGPGSSLVMTIAGEKKLVSLIVDDISKQLENNEFDPGAVQERLRYLLGTLSEEQRGNLPEPVGSVLETYRRGRQVNFLVGMEESGRFDANRFNGLKERDRSALFNLMKDEVATFLEKKEGDVSKIEAEARMLFRVSSEEERQAWPEALRKYIEAPHHHYTQFPPDEQFDRMYQDVTGFHRTAQEFRSQMAKLPVDVQEKLIKKIVEDSKAYGEAKLGQSLHQTNRIKHGVILMELLHRDAAEITEFKSKLDLDLAKGAVHWARHHDEKERGNFPAGGIQGKFNAVYRFLKETNNPEAKAIYLKYLQDYDQSLLGNTKELERLIKNLRMEDSVMTRTAKDPSTILMADKKTTMKEFLLKQEGVEEREDGSLYVKAPDDVEYDIVTSFAKHSNTADAWYVKVVSSRDPLEFKVLELKEFHEKLKHGGLTQMIEDARESRKEEVTHEDALTAYDLPNDVKTVVLRTFPISPDLVVALTLDSSHHMATALQAHYGEGVDIKPITFGKEAMLAQINELYTSGSRSFFVNAYGHGGKHDTSAAGIHLDDGQFSAEDIKKLLENYPEAHFIIATGGCYGGGLAAGIEAFMKDEPELTKRLILMTQTKPDIYNYGGRLGGTYEASFTKSIYSGTTFGEAVRNADIENKKQRSIDADTIIHGIKIGDRRPVKAEELLV